MAWIGLFNKIEDGLPEYLRWIFHLPVGAYIGFTVLCLAGWLYIKYLKFISTLDEEYTLLEITPTDRTLKSSLSTSQLFSTLHSLVQGDPRLFYTIQRSISLEIASTKEDGIRFILRVPKTEANLIIKNIRSYLPGVEINQVEDYFSKQLAKVETFEHLGVQEMKLANSYLFSLENQDTLNQVDPIGYLTGQMTQLVENELVVAQFIATPIHQSTHRKTTGLIRRVQRRLEENLDISDLILSTRRSFSSKLLNWLLNDLMIDHLIPFTGQFINHILSLFFPITESKTRPHSARGKYKHINELGVHKQEQYQGICKKISQPLFDTTIRFVIYTPLKDSIKDRLKGMSSAYETVQSENQKLKRGKYFKPFLSINSLNKFYLLKLEDRLPLIAKSVILSAAELSSLYHLPFTATTKTEDLQQVKSPELPAPLSLKNQALDVVFGKNSYGGVSTNIGLTEEDRLTHIYVLGRTGSGKTTMLFSMAKHDIEQGRGLAFIDPHGDVAEDLLASVPIERKNDLIYINPIDLKYPIGINLLELTPNLDEDEAELEKEVVAEGVISLFRKVFSSDENSNAHRIEYILRNTIYTAFTAPGCTLFTINKILTNPDFRKKVIAQLTDEDLKDFWKYEFGKAGDYQVVKMTQGVTSKVGRFLRSPTARRILEQEKSTINFDEIINSGKILLCNFSQGKLGEDSSRILGVTIMTKLQQAALKRAYLPIGSRSPFYLYVDEFQTFASSSFKKMIAEGRKYRMPLIIAEQSTSQQHDRDITNVILANATTVVSFRSGNYIDEELMLHQFGSRVEKGAIMNLPRYHFYMKVSAAESEDPFSGETIHQVVKKNPQKTQILIAASRKNWAIKYQKPSLLTSLPTEKPTSVKTPKQNEIYSDKKTLKSGFPES